MERRQRHARNREAGRQPYRITENDREIFRLLARYRYLRTSFIYDLLPHRSRQGLSRSLRRLFDHGYVDKPREQRRGYNDIHCPDIYELDGKGEKVLHDQDERPLEITRLYRKKTDAPVKNFSHSMMICDVMASIELGLQDTGFELVTWQEIVARTDHENPMKLPCSIRHTFKDGHSESHETYIIPDGLFGIRRPAGAVSFFAVETERFNPIEPTNLKRASFLKKVLAYRNIQQTGVYKTDLKIPNMRILVIAPTETRMNHMIELTERITQGSNLFLFANIPVQEQFMRALGPMPELATLDWRRANRESTQLIN